MDEEVCAYCEAETVDGNTSGWKQEEFGWKCPECRVEAPDATSGSNDTAGMAGMVGILKSAELEKKS